MSGDMNTALGNCLLMCAIVFCLMEQVTGDMEYELANNGDDCVLIQNRDNLEQFDKVAPAFMNSVGLPTEFEKPVLELERISFCQSHPVFDGTRWTMVRDPRVCLDKDIQSLKPVRTEAEWNVFRNTIGLSGLALAGHMPVFTAFYEALRRGAGTRVDKDMTPTGFKMLAKGMNMSNVSVTPEARASFFVAFDISPDEQEALEAFYELADLSWREPLKDGARSVGAVASCMGSQG
jgi:hypothetical protein